MPRFILKWIRVFVIWFELCFGLEFEECVLVCWPFWWWCELDCKMVFICLIVFENGLSFFDCFWCSCWNRGFLVADFVVRLNHFFLHALGCFEQLNLVVYVLPESEGVNCGGGEVENLGFVFTLWNNFCFYFLEYVFI